MTKRDGNTDALRAHKADSVKETRQELELAIRRIVNGNPQHVKKGTPLSPAVSVYLSALLPDGQR